MTKPSIWPSKWLSWKEKMVVLGVLLCVLFFVIVCFFMGGYALIVKIVVLLYVYAYFPLYLFDKDMLPSAGTFSFEEDDADQQVARTVTAGIALIVYFGVLFFYNP